MSSSSESSLTELPLPYDISSAVSRALRINSAGSVEENPLPRTRSRRSLSFPGYYDFPAHQGSSVSAYNGSDGENYAAAAAATASCYCSSASNPYFYSIPSTDPQNPYFYPQHHYPAIHPSDPQVQMEVEAWTENTTISICNSSTDLLESQANIEQLDRFCKYIDSSGDEELITDRGESSMLSSIKANYECYIAGRRSAMIGSPPKKKRKNACAMSLSSYFEEDYVGMDEIHDWKVELENDTMWREFDNVGTEMVITKAGRRMFPTLSVKVSGLDPNKAYTIKLDILPADNRRYKYLQSEWVAVGRSDKKQIYCEYEHPDSPNSGSYWTDKIVAFKMVKLTNNKNSKCADQVILNSMHKYLPCMKIMCLKDGYTQSFSFPETSFIAVTAYQSTGVTQLKINNNPYARAFRESLPSGGSQKNGGHCRHSSNRTNSPISPNHAGDASSQQNTPSSSPRHKVHSKQKTHCHSSVSVESGFESDTANDKRKDSTSLIPSQTSQSFNSQQSLAPLSSSYWADDSNNSLWNPNLITPDPLMETNDRSFSVTYLEDTAKETEYEMRDSDDSSSKDMLDMLPETSIDLSITSVEPAIPSADDDVFF